MLPTELCLLVTSFVDRETLKALRLTSHDFLPSATEILYREMHLSPNSHSFDRAHEVATRRHLSEHVKSLVYHFGMLGDYYPGFDAFKHEYFAARKPGEIHDPSEVTADVLLSYGAWLEEIDAQRTFDLRDEKDELQTICDRLPNLEVISTLLDEVESMTNPQDYFGRRTGMFAGEDDGSGRFANLFGATMSKPLKKISARSIQWFDMLTIQSMLVDPASRSLAQQCLQTIRYLEIGIYNPLNRVEDENGNVRSNAQALGSVLSAAQNLEVLRLDFDELPFDSHADDMLPLSNTIFKHHWPALKELKLEAICTYEEVLLDFLCAHSKSLCELQLGDIELVKLDTEQRCPSILRLFRGIKECLKLTSCTITGNFTNRIDQAWYVDTEIYQPDCLRDSIQQYMCQNLAKTVGGHLVDHWLQTPSTTFEPFCDDSFYWCPELLEGDDNYSQTSRSSHDISEA